MRKILFLLKNKIYVVIMIIFSQVATASVCTKLFDDNGQATKNLMELLEVTKATINGPKTLSNIANSAAIKKWHEHPNKERWYFQLPAHLKENASDIINICENKLGMRYKILPKDIKNRGDVKYSGVLFLGASFFRVDNRADFYNKLLSHDSIDRKLKVWVLSGERKLDANIGETNDNFYKLMNAKQPQNVMPTDELSMIKFVFHYKMPKDIDVEYIDSKKEQDFFRATTASTVKAWAQKIPYSSQVSYYLGISNQPYIGYQELVVNLVLKEMGKKNIVVHMVGDASQPASNLDNHAAILLDTVAKIIELCSRAAAISPEGAATGFSKKEDL